MKVDISYSKASMKFLKKNPQTIALQEIQAILIASLKKILRQEDINVDAKQLQGIGKDIIAPEKATSESFSQSVKKKLPLFLCMRSIFEGMCINTEHI